MTGYSFARKLTRRELLEIAEPIPDGASVKALIQIANEYDIAICAGLFEKDHRGDLFKAYVCVDRTGVLAKFRKLHPFINPNIKAGDSYCVFDFKGWKFGILICYDNNITENVRATRLLGAQVLLMPHVTMCTPSPRPGAGFVDSKLWQQKRSNEKMLHEEFRGPKGREWLMKWLPARAYDNGIYCVFSNPIGMDDDQLKNGCSMILDPFGNILAECTSLGDEVAISKIEAHPLLQAGGYRYIEARRPELYAEIIGTNHHSRQNVAWLTPDQTTSL